MTLSKEILFFFCGLGVFNGLLLSIYLFLSGKRKNSVYFLGLLLLSLSLRIGKSVWVFFIPHLSKLYLQIGLSACFMIGPSLIYFIKAEQEAPRKIPGRWWAEWSMLLGVIVTAGLIFPYVDYPAIWNRFFIKIIYAQWGCCIALSGYLLRQELRILFLRRGKVAPKEAGLMIIWGAVAIIYLLYLTTLLIGSRYLYITGALSFSLALYFIVAYMVYQKKSVTFWPDAGKYGNKKISSDGILLMQNRLKEVMGGKLVFKNPNLKLADLATELEVSPHQLSQYLNEHEGKTFTAFVNEYRIQEACKLLLVNNTYTIEAIGMDVGFNSKSTFFTAFKKVKGTTPAAFQQEHLAPARQ